MTDEDRVARDSKLRDAILRGDELAWQSLYDESFEAIWKYVEWRCGGNRSMAEDVVQETWVVAVKRIRGFMPQKAGFTTWLCGIAAKNLQACFRRERQRSRGSLDGEREPLQSEHKSTDEEISIRIAAALAGLPERFEAVLRAKYLDSMTVDEIAGRWASNCLTPSVGQGRRKRRREVARGLGAQELQPKR
jgi:RNA polymerase sigma-70 factor, ECF subfamily